MNQIPAENYMIDCQQPHAEVIEVATRTVWQGVKPITHEELAQLDLPHGFAPVGVGSAVMNEHYFRQSPGAEAPGPVTERINARYNLYLATKFHARLNFDGKDPL